MNISHGKLISVKCLNPNCNNYFNIYQSEYDKKKKLYCCRKCRSEHHWMITPLYEKPCLNCGNIMKRKFMQKLERLKYCSPTCRKTHKCKIFQEKLKDVIKSNCSICNKELINKREPCGKLIPRKTCDECIKKTSKKTALNMCNVVNNRYKNDLEFRKKVRSSDKSRSDKVKRWYSDPINFQKWATSLKDAFVNGQSKIENVVYGHLQSKILDNIERYYPISNMLVDFYIPEKKLVVECFGDYWHMNPLKYKSTNFNTSTKRTAKEQWEKDKRRRLFMESNGYKVVELWESEINNGDYKKLDIYM